MLPKVRTRSSTPVRDARRLAPAGGIALDVGSAFVHVAELGRRVTEEPSVVAVETGHVVRAGWQALASTRVPNPARAVVEPVRGGVPADHDLLVALLRKVRCHVATGNDRPAPVIAAVPTTSTDAQREDLASCIRRAFGTTDVITVVAPVAAAVGARLSPTDPTPSLVVDVGHHLTEAAIVAGGAAVSADAGWVGGADAQAALVAHARARGIDPGPRSVERALRLSSHAIYGSVSIRGLDERTGQARVLQLGAHELEELLDPVLDGIAAVAQHALDSAPAEVAEGARRGTALLTGGMARVHGVADRIATNLGIEAVIADAPQRAVINGLRRRIHATDVEHHRAGAPAARRRSHHDGRA